MAEVKKVDMREQPPLSLAFVGDGIFGLLVRRNAVERTRLMPGKLHNLCTKFVSAKGQCEALVIIEPFLTDEEKNILRRGLNSSKATVAKNASVQQYRTSTGVEALFGYLYLSGANERVEQLFDMVWNDMYPKITQGLL